MTAPLIPEPAHEPAHALAHAPPAPLSRAARVRAALRGLARRVQAWFFVTLGVLAVAPFALILPLNFVQPTTTMVMLRRTVQRTIAGKSPRYPRREVISRDAISPYLRRAVLASEDDRFYLHWGFDLKQIQEAIQRAQRGRRLRGASTITQQVAKNLFLWEGRSYFRKGYEAYLTIVLEICLPKERILDLYLNLAEWGDGVFGAEMASQVHFRKPASALTMEEAARLAAVLPSPVRWSPKGAVASRRAPLILETMRYEAPRSELAHGRR